MKLPLTEPEMSLFAQNLGEMLLKLPVISGTVGHRRAEYTVRDYLQATTAEQEFLIDLMSRPIPEVLLKWYPRQEHANGMTFWYPGVSVGGGPGKTEMQEAANALEKRGEKQAEYSEDEPTSVVPSKLSQLTQPDRPPA